VSTLLWGSGDFWPWTKAHHYLWFKQALDEIRNPRHTLYSRLEEDFGLLSFLSGQVSVRGISMATITSDLYGIYLVIFSDIPELPVQTRGSYGAPHRFLYVTNNIQFGPMRPCKNVLSSMLQKMLTPVSPFQFQTLSKAVFLALPLTSQNFQKEGNTDSHII
jgi:hypothetical protein